MLGKRYHTRIFTYNVESAVESKAGDGKTYLSMLIVYGKSGMGLPILPEDIRIPGRTGSPNRTYPVNSSHLPFLSSNLLEKPVQSHGYSLISSAYRR
jgi:hypothetical protein